jgi:hypothetical protein
MGILHDTIFEHLKGVVLSGQDVNISKIQGAVKKTIDTISKK